MKHPSHEVADVLREWSIDPRTAEISAAEGGFSGAAVYRVAPQDDLVYCLRRWPSKTNSVRIRGLHRFLNHVYDRGVQLVAVPLASDKNQTLIHHSGRVWQLEPWLPGVADFRDSPSDTRLANAMQALAAFHTAALQFQPIGPESEWFRSEPSGQSPSIRQRLQLARKWTPNLFREARSRLTTEPHAGLRDVMGDVMRLAEPRVATVTAELQAHVDVRVPLLPCLRDVWHDHLLFSGDRVSGLIDPAATLTETVATDLSRLLGSFVADSPRAWQFALEEYGTHRELTDNEQKMIPVFDHSSILLSALTWVDRRLLRNEQLHHPSAVATRLAGYRDRLSHNTLRP